MLPVCVLQTQAAAVGCGEAFEMHEVSQLMVKGLAMRLNRSLRH
jgi:hypothetical protein